MKEFNEDQARELYLYTINKTEVYHGCTRSILLGLNKKFKKGQYDADKAAKAFERSAEAGAKYYEKDFLKKGDWCKVFTPADRKEAAKRMEKHYKQEVEEIQ